MTSPQAQALANYIRQQMQAGYTEEQLRQYLLQYGYQQQVVDEAFNIIHPKGLFSNIKINVSPKVLVIGAVAIVAILLILSLFFLFSGGQNIELSAQSRSSNIQAGEQAQIRLSVGQEPLRDDATVSLRLISQTGNIAAAESFTMRGAQSSQTFSLNIPQSIPQGSYTVRAVLSTDGNQFEATTSIEVAASEQPIEPEDPTQPVVEREGTCFDGIKNGLEGGIDCGGDCPACQSCPASCDDNNACTQEICSFDTGYECVYSPVVPCCGNGQCESNRGENQNTCFADCEGFTPPEPEKELTPNQIIQKVSTEDLDENEAGALCSALPEEGFIDDCFNALASKTENPLFCLYTSTNSSRDSCYMLNFVVNGKEIPDLCTEIYNSYLRQNCEALSKIQESNIDLDSLQNQIDEETNQTQSNSA